MNSPRPTTKLTAKLKPPPDFWHAANCAFTARQRREFNAWKDRLYLTADRLEGYVNLAADPWSEDRWERKLSASMVELKRSISEIPSLAR